MHMVCSGDMDLSTQQLMPDGQGKKKCFLVGQVRFVLFKIFRAGRNVLK